MLAYLANDNVVRLTGARAVLLSTGVSQYLNAGATVEFRVQTLAGTDVDGETWPVTMAYITGSDGDFIGVLRDTVELVESGSYFLVATVSNGVDQRGTWRIPLQVLARMT